MFFFFTCGTHTFTSAVKGAEHITVTCQNCGNHSGRVLKRWEWFTFCFVPVIPFSLKPYREVGCHVCNFWQDVKYRPDVLGMLENGHGGGGQQGGMMMMGGDGSGYGGGGPGGPGGGGAGDAGYKGGQGEGGAYGPPPQGVPQYK